MVIHIEIQQAAGPVNGDEQIVFGALQLREVGHVNMKIPRLVLLEFLGLRLILFWHLVDAETNEGAVNIAPASIRDARLDDLGKFIQGTPGQCPHHPDDLFFKGV
ncbi:MAG: hypothetical protein PHO08_20655 [Methylococcales bacterium]|nr:hypothetical protein [Methylococcales bacterium]